jgi:hypothetical protein
MLFTFLTGIVGFVFPAGATLLGAISYLFLSYIIHIATWFAALPFAAFSVPAFPLTVMVLMYLIIGYVLYRVSMRTKEGALDIDFSSIADWTIVEETDGVTVNTTKGHSSEERPLPEVSLPPIFFR